MLVTDAVEIKALTHPPGSLKMKKKKKIRTCALPPLPLFALPER